MPEHWLHMIRNDGSIPKWMWSLTEERALEPLNPREIQFRVRSGESPEMVAAATGWPIDRVTRYAEPPLGERSYVAERAQRTYVHLTKGGATLLEIIGITTGQNIAEWDSFYLNGQWIVTASNGVETAQWTYEPQGNSVHPINSTARTWMGIETAQSIPDSSDTIIIENEPVRLVAVPALEKVVEQEAISEEDVAEEVVSEEGIAEQVLPLNIQPTPEKSIPKKAKQRGRAKVPSWDEILFGGPKKSD